MKYLVTGAAGFIGYHVVKLLLDRGEQVIGIDNLNNYYDVNLKFSRLLQLGISKNEISFYKKIESSLYANFSFTQMNLEDNSQILDLFKSENFDYVCNLAAQAGVRYSLENPYAYVKSNIEGFLNILEGCRLNEIKHLVYASSSSVYGLNGKIPYSEKDSIGHPVSLYAATKKADELMAHAYSHLYKLPTTGLRFFTVYGPWGRPDMSPFLFADAILHNRPIKVFNHGDMLRDFTYVDDIAKGVILAIDRPAESSGDWNVQNPDPSISSSPYRIFNIGNSSPIKLIDFIHAIEKCIGKESEKIYMPMQSGDVYQTNADVSMLQKATGFRPNTSLEEGVSRTIKWFRTFYNL